LLLILFFMSAENMQHRGAMLLDLYRPCVLDRYMA
jgi:hypothetical protein